MACRRGRCVFVRGSRRESSVQRIRHRRDTGNGACVSAPLRLLDGVLLDRSARAAPAGRGRDRAPEGDRQPPRRRRSEATIRTPKQTLGTCAACARRTAGYILKTKAIFSGDSEKVTVRPVDSPSLGASTSSSFDGALITFSAAGARRPVAAAQNASSSTAPL
jgi:hypothetical protein